MNSMISTLLVWLMCTPFMSVAQDVTRQESTYLLPSSIQTSGFGGVIVEPTFHADFTSVSMGGGGGIMLNKRLSIGLYGMGSVNSPSISTIDSVEEIENISLGQGGLTLGVNFWPHSPVQLIIGSRIGYGSVDVETTQQSYSDDALFIYPHVASDLRFSRAFKVDIGMGYKIVEGLNIPMMSSNMFNGFTTHLGISFGWF
jgi:hypothetical protein